MHKHCSFGILYFQKLSGFRRPFTNPECHRNLVREYYHKKENYAEYNGFKFNFIDPPSGTLLCQQCKSLAYEPHHFRCCHSLFCKKCITLSTCPICCEHSKAIPDHRSDKLIQNLTVWCPNSVADGLGCHWKGELRKVLDHRRECPREKVPCSYGCKEKMYRNKLEEHDRKNQRIHLNLAMKKVVSLTTTVKQLQERVEQLEELQESVEQLKTSFQEFKIYNV